MAFPRWLWVALPLWLLGCGLSIQFGLSYQFAPGKAADAPPVWPAASSIPLDPSRPTLVMACHPRCPCTQASLSELERLQARRPGRFSVHLLMLSPSQLSWEDAAMWRQARSYSWISVWPDPDRQQSSLFGAWTSGQVLLYDPSGRLRFSGGITAGRGHEGENPGMEMLTAALEGGPASSAPVYGCSLVSPGACCREGKR